MANSSGSLAITLPDGREASFEEMQAYGNIMRDFIRDQEAKLPQVEDIHRHNEIIDYLQLLASAYNEQVRIYKVAEKQKQRHFMIVLTRAVSS
jgi:hypothetical protein